MKYIQLNEHIQAGPTLGCYVVYGEDGYLIKQAIKEFCTLADAFPEFNTVEYDETVSADVLLECAKGVPLMSKYKVIIAPFTLAGALKQYVKSPNPSTVLVFYDYALQIKAISGVEPVECSRLADYQLTKTVNEICKTSSATITNDAAQTLIEYTGRYMGKIVLELEKILSYKVHEKKIEKADVQRLVTPDLEYRVFELSDAIARQNASRSITILNDMLSEGAGSWNKVFGLIYTHFRRLMYVSLLDNADEAASALELKEFAVKSLTMQSKRFSKVKLKRMLDSLHAIDCNLKQGKGSDKVLFHAFVLSMAE